MYASPISVADDFDRVKEELTVEIKVEKALEELKGHISAIKDLMAGLEFIKKYSDSTVEIPDLSVLLSSHNLNEVNPGNNTATTFKPDSFYGLEAPVAAEKYLKSIGHAVPFEQIYEALLKGGFESDGDKVKVHMSLTRATQRLKKFGSGVEASFGLLEWYPKKIKRTAIPEENSEDIRE